MKRHAFVPILLAGLAGSCNSTGPTAPSADPTLLAGIPETGLWLAYNESGVLDDGGLVLSFDGLLEESRCPSDVVCVWEGRGRIEVGVNVSGQPEVAAVLAIPGLPDGGSVVDGAAVSVGGYRLTLLELRPYPVSTSQTALEAYSARILVESFE